ncbi:unnamed protein product, partial [Nezara viridula]
KQGCQRVDATTAVRFRPLNFIPLIPWDSFPKVWREEGRTEKRVGESEWVCERDRERERTHLVTTGYWRSNYSLRLNGQETIPSTGVEVESNKGSIEPQAYGGTGYKGKKNIQTKKKERTKRCTAETGALWSDPWSRADRKMSPAQTALVLAATVGVVCIAWPHHVMAIDLSRLYGHVSAKRNSEYRIE